MYTRIYLNDHINTLANKEGISIAYLMTDIDKFKIYNDTYGHQQGDLALRTVAEELKKSIESTIVDKEYAFVARYGGEEFCAFLTNFNGDREELKQRGYVIRDNIKNLIIPASPQARVCNEGIHKVTLTIGGAIRKPDENIEDLIKRADDELTNAKDEGNRNNVYIAK